MEEADYSLSNNSWASHNIGCLGSLVRVTVQGLRRFHLFVCIVTVDRCQSQVYVDFLFQYGLKNYLEYLDGSDVVLENDEFFDLILSNFYQSLDTLPLSRLQLQWSILFH